jgi:RHS repeat-associated protein
VILDINGDLVMKHHYLPFGEERPTAVNSSNPTINNKAFTGHERDQETGIDYMMARYYGSSLDRFMSPDKGKDIRPESPQTWNAYTYVGSNPLIYTDPTGEYVCNGSKSQCKSFGRGLRDAKRAARHLKGGERKALKRALNSYGREGKDNGVTVQFGDVEGGNASTVTSHGRTTATFDLEGMGTNLATGEFGSSYAAELAGSVAHEGVHVEQQQDRGMPTSREETKAAEVFAYAVQALVNKGLNTNSLYGVWNRKRGFNPTFINDYAEKSTAQWCEDNPKCD